jgi:hypothetical protein
MQPIEIIVIIACVLIVGGVTVSSIINKKKGKNGCGCDCSRCSSCNCSIKPKQNSDHNISK